MTVEIDPALQRRFEQNLADHQASVARVDATLAARQREITEQAAKAEARSKADQGELLSTVKEKFAKPKAEPDKPRVVGWNPSASTGQHTGVMSFGDEEDPVEAPPRAPAAPPRPVTPPPAPASSRAARHRRPSEPDEDDYSEQSWLSE